MAFEITIPRLGWSMEEGTFAGWQKKDGDTIRRGDILFDLEGEKALQEIESVDEGILRIPPNSPPVGAVLRVGAIVGYLVGPDEPLPWTVSSIATSPKAENAIAEVVESLDSQPAASPSVRRLARQLDVRLTGVVGTGPTGRITEEDVHSAAASTPQPSSNEGFAKSGSAAATPRARRTAKKLGLDWKAITGTGRNGRIRERDVLREANQQSSGARGSGSENPMAGGGDRRVLLSGRRKVIAARLSKSARQTVPVTITTRADATNLMGLREQFKATGQSPVPAVHDIVAKLLADALRQFPLLAGRWDGDAILLPDPDHIHLGLAVDTPDGLIVPVVRNVSTQSLMNVAKESSRVIAKARDGRLTASEMQDAVFTISNLGGFGVDAFTPVINLPETAILGLGAIRQEPVVQDDGQIVVRRMITLSLTFDHRAIDGAPAARFLRALVAAIANPAARLISLG